MGGRRQGRPKRVADQEPQEADGQAEEERILLPHIVRGSTDLDGQDIGSPDGVVDTKLGDAKLIDDDTHHAEQETCDSGCRRLSSLPEEADE